VSRSLDDLAQRLKALAKGIDRLLEPVARRITSAVDREFTLGVDARGKRWSPLKRTGRPAHLTETGALRASVKAEPRSGSVVEVTLEDAKASFHQHGTSRMVARPILPAVAPLPDDWRDAVADEHAANVRDALTK
jgi:phage gpG-like protein